MLADIAPGYTVFCSATPDCINSREHEPVADGRRHQRGHAAARRRPRAGRRGPAPERPPRHRLRQPAALQDRAQPDVAQARCSPTCRSSATTSARSSPRSHRSLGCCKAGPGFDRASGWGSVNLSGLAAVAALLIHPRVGLSLPRHQHPAKLGAVFATLSCSAACRVGAFAEVRIGHGKPFKVYSGIAALLGSGQDHGPDRLRPQAPAQDALGAAPPPGRSAIEVFGRLYGGGTHVVKRTGSKTLAYPRLSCRFPSGLGRRPAGTSTAH